MVLRLVQVAGGEAGSRVAALDDEGPGRIVRGAVSILDLARQAIDQGVGLADVVAQCGLGEALEVEAELAHGRVLCPAWSAEGARTVVSGTGLTHLGSAQSRDDMHRKLAAESLTDSMKMFKIGLEGGKPAPGVTGAQPEWFYKGDGSMLAAPL